MEDNKVRAAPSEVHCELDNQKKQCWVCFGTESDDTADVVWLSPCECKGSMKWVHEECLQRWIDEKQIRTHSQRVSCSQCKWHYIMVFPPVNYLVKLLEQYDRILYGSSPLVAVSVVVGSIYWCCGSFGFITIIQIMGYEEGKNMIDEMDPFLLVIGLPVIPVALILAKLIKWEDYILRLWRQRTFKIPRPLSYFIEGPPALTRANGDRILLDPGFNEPIGCTRLICGALLLPTVSALVGKIFFSTFTESQWRRSLLGGLAFLLIKGAMKIYLRKCQFKRYSQRTIKNYDHSQSGRSMTTNEQTTSENPAPSFNNVSNGSDFDDEDRDDDNSQRPRPRMFSINIEL